MKLINPITSLLVATTSGTEALRGLRNKVPTQSPTNPATNPTTNPPTNSPTNLPTSSPTNPPTNQLLQITNDAKSARQLNSKKLDLTIINEAFQQPFGAFFVMVHNNTAPILYRRGQPASEELARLAEDGNPGPLVDFYRTQQGVYDVFAFNDNVPYFLGDTATISVDVPADHFVTIASMAINTNDCFVSINRQMLYPGQVLHLPGLDAGTEVNNEDCRSIPGPACSAESGNRRDGNGEGFVHVHRGFFGVGDPNDPEFLSEKGYDWRNPMLRIVVTEAGTEIAPQPPTQQITQPEKRDFVVSLKADAEVSNFTGMWAGKGDVEVTFEQNEACIDTVIDGFPPALAHLHKGPIDTNGDVSIDFSPLINTNIVKGCVPVDSAIISEILNDPSGFYINMHVGVKGATENDLTFNQGIRQQLISSLETVLEPEQEVGDFTGVQGASGNGVISFHKGGSIACFDVNVDGFAPVLGHVHEGIAGTNGGVFINFSSLIDGDGSLNGCIPIESSKVVAMLKNPSGFYFNVHNGASPDDAGFFEGIRGQF